MMFRRGKPAESDASDSDPKVVSLDDRAPDSQTGAQLDGPAGAGSGDHPADPGLGAQPDAAGTLPDPKSASSVKGTDMSSPTSKAPGTGFVPEIPRRAVDIPGSPIRRPGPPSGVQPGNRMGGEHKRLQVGREISLSGEITACDTLVVEGTVDAKLENSQFLEITETGTFRGAVRIEEASVAGLFDGDLTVRGTLSVKNKGEVKGKIRYGRLEIELGGVVRGDIAPFEENEDG
jgi:cytoskeletal protein CcmA (bactofilin family)